MSDKKVKKKHKKSKHFTVLSYFQYALIYVLVSMIVVIPVSIGVLSKAVSTVHKAQTVMTASENEIAINDDMPSADNYLNELTVGRKMGAIKCESAGIYENIYYGLNRVTQRNGVGFDQGSYLFGVGGASKIAGYSSSSLKSMSKVNVGDVIAVDVPWGEYSYKVTDVVTGKTIDTPDGDCLILASYNGTQAFSSLTGEKIYVVATLINEEVQ